MKKATEGTVAGTNTNTSSLPREVSIEIALNELAVLLALKQVADEKGLTLAQLSGFHTPWVKAPASKEEGFFQDLVWIHKVLPPNEKFNPDKAKKGYYRGLKAKLLNDFWKKYNPELDEHTHSQRHIRPLQKQKIQLKQPTRRCWNKTNV